MDNDNIENSHQEMVDKLCKSGESIMSSMTSHKMHLLHMASKLCSEAGELMDAIGKNSFYNKDLDMANVIEELGDMEFYMHGIRKDLGIIRADTLYHNMNKLDRRYSEGYSDKAAHARTDKT